MQTLFRFLSDFCCIYPPFVFIPSPARRIPPHYLVFHHRIHNLHTFSCGASTSNQLLLQQCKYILTYLAPVACEAYIRTGVRTNRLNFFQTATVAEGLNKVEPLLACRRHADPNREELGKTLCPVQSTTAHSVPFLPVLFAMECKRRPPAPPGFVQIHNTFRWDILTPVSLFLPHFVPAVTPLTHSLTHAICASRAFITVRGSITVCPPPSTTSRSLKIS